nr:hypothetical protein [Pedobacter sp. ASV19]
MKPLTALNNVEMARLLFDLVPEHIPGFIEFITRTYNLLIEQREETEKNWDDGWLTFQSWLNLAETTQSNINVFGDKLTKKSQLFADRLFDGYNAIWSRHCATQYAVQEKCPVDFKNAVTLLFDRDRTRLYDLRIRLEELNRDTESSIKKACASLLKFSGEETIDINTVDALIYIGEYQEQLKGYACLTTLKVKTDELYIETDFTGRYRDFEECTDLRISDKLAILNILLIHPID